MGKISVTILLMTILCNFSSGVQQPTPIVIWHGMGDSCCNPMSMGRIKDNLERDLPGVHITSLMLGNSAIEDLFNSFLLHPDEQIELACDWIKSDPALANGYNAIGFSQGGIFLRALLQRCPEPKMKNLVSVGGPQQGVYGLPSCDAADFQFCDVLRKLVNKLVYISEIQNILVQSTFWQDATNKTAYIEGSTFLANINNEATINQAYIENLQSLENFILIKFENDSVIQPVESQWFQFYKPGDTSEIQALQETEIYERLGLKQMDADGKLHFLATPGDHLDIDWAWFRENVVKIFLE